MTWNDPYGAGMGPAGYSPLPAASRVRSIAAPLALRFDGATGDWVIDPNGEYVIDHPADQAVALSLCIKRGTIKVARKVGNDIFQITPGPNIDGQVETAVKHAFPLSRYLADGTISLRKIEHATGPHGRLAVRVYYKNTALGTNGVFPPQ